MKKLFLSILMITGLSLSSQVKSTVKLSTQITENTNPTVVATPLADPTTGVETDYIKCDAGNAHYVSDGCCIAEISCTNGNKYTLIICPNEPVRILQSARTIESDMTTYDADINISLTSNISVDPNTQLDPISRVINQRKLLNSYITLGTDLAFNFANSTLIIKAGIYKVFEGKLQVNCQ
jgi:hypothetical protein